MLYTYIHTYICSRAVFLSLSFSLPVCLSLCQCLLLSVVSVCLSLSVSPSVVLSVSLSLALSLSFSLSPARALSLMHASMQEPLCFPGRPRGRSRLVSTLRPGTRTDAHTCCIFIDTHVKITCVLSWFLLRVLLKHKHKRARAHTHTHTLIFTCICMPQHLGTFSTSSTTWPTRRLSMP